MSPSPNTHLAFTPAPGVVAFACGFTSPEPIALMRARASTPPEFFLWTFERAGVGCPACLAAPASALAGAITGDEIRKRLDPLAVKCPLCRAVAGVACAESGHFLFATMPAPYHHERWDAGLRRMLEWLDGEYRRAGVAGIKGGALS
jgi:hypothetical protein